MNADSPAPREQEAVPLAPPRGASGADAPAPDVAGERIKILLVDDEPKNLIALETVLEHPGYELVRAGSADEALLALVAHEFALLVLDIQMPGMNGFELAQLIKTRKKTADIPIIFLTAFYSEDEHVLEGYGSGAVDYLHKPINAVVLRSKVAVFAALHRKTHESARANQALLAEVAERRHMQEQLRELNDDLERRVAARTAALAESEARFRALAEEMPHLVWETDAAGRATYQNAKWQTFTGLTLGPGHEGWLGVVHPDDAPRLEEAWAGALRSGEECDLFCRLRRASDGAYRWFQVKSAPVRRAAVEIIRWVGTGTDIEQQRQAEDGLREADKRKDEFLAMLGHELRNPLAAIRHAVRLGAEKDEDPVTRGWADGVIDRQSLQLSRMVDDLLDVERINRGRIDLRLETLDLRDVLARAAAVVHPIMEQQGHVFAIAPNEGGLPLRGDAARLEQVFVNLLNNAAKYTPPGGRIRLAARREGDEAVISVSDSGSGVSPELLPHVFELFRQEDKSLDRAQGGLGIGLTVVKALVEMHAGRVEMANGGVLGGATATVRLPLGSNALAVGKASVPPPAPAVIPAGLRVLIVEDHIDAAEALSRLLARRKCEVRVAHDGPAGLNLAREFRPEVLLLDLGLPGLDGYELARALRAEAPFAESLLIAISGYAQESDRARSLAAGFDHHCAKPVDFAALLAAIQTKRSAHTAPSPAATG